MKNLALILLFIFFTITANEQSYRDGYVNYNSSSNLQVPIATLQPNQTSDITILGISFTGLTDYFKFGNTPDRKNINEDASGSYIWSEETTPTCPNKYVCGTASNPGTYTDPRVGNTYTTLQIGTQCWMQDNLFETSYMNGDAMPANNVGFNTTSGAWAVPNGSAATTPYISGWYYNWYAVNDPRGLCPLGWYVPSNNDWGIICNYLGGTAVAGGYMKATSTVIWSSCGPSTTPPVCGLNLQCGGYQTGGYNGYQGNYWCSSPVGSTNAYVEACSCTGTYFAVGYYIATQTQGYTVRCMKDN